MNDNYQEGSNIKDDEHDRRASHYNDIPNVYPKCTDKFPSPTEFKKILLNSSNKVRLQRLVKESLKSNVHSFMGEIIYCEPGRATNLTTGAELDDFVFDQIEADTMMLTAYSQLRAYDTGDVVIDSEDTDVSVQAAYVSQHVDGNLYMKHKNELYDCSKFLSQDVAEIIIPFHMMSGYDNTPGFYGHGKKSLLDKVMKDAEARDLLSRVGRSIDLKDDVISDMRKFVLSKIYGENFPTCAQARASKWHKLKKKKTSRLPPDDDTLLQHFKKVNYLAYCQLHFSLEQHPSLIGNGWEIINEPI